MVTLWRAQLCWINTVQSWTQATTMLLHYEAVLRPNKWSPVTILLDILSKLYFDFDEETIFVF